MRNFKAICLVVLIAIGGVVGNNFLKQRNALRVSTLSLTTIEALTNQETNTSNHRYPDRSGNAEFCNLYVYIDTQTGAKIGPSNTEISLSSRFVKSTISGLKDRCPNSGKGCNPYSCQEVPY